MRFHSPRTAICGPERVSHLTGGTMRLAVSSPSSVLRPGKIPGGVADPGLRGLSGGLRMPGTKKSFASHTKPRNEETLVTLLGRRSISTFLPRLLVRHCHGTSVGSSESPISRLRVRWVLARAPVAQPYQADARSEASPRRRGTASPHPQDLAHSSMNALVAEARRAGRGIFAVT
jgi:hypothetical protein